MLGAEGVGDVHLSCGVQGAGGKSSANSRSVRLARDLLSVEENRRFMVARQRGRTVSDDLRTALPVRHHKVALPCLIGLDVSVIRAERTGYEIVAVRLSVFAAPVNAARNWQGNSFPRFSARRRIPAQAFALKKYRRGSSPVSKMSDNEHATAPLGNSEELSVKNPVGEPIPAFCQPPEEGSKIPPSTGGQDTRDVFPDHPSGSKPPSNCQIDEHEVASRIIESLSESRDAEALTGGAANEKVNCSNVPLLKLCHVAEVRNVGVVVRQDSAREGFNL
jgi:hypothetical protein